MICSICHGVVGYTIFLHVSCSCDMHSRCARGSVEDAIPRTTSAGVRQVTCPNLALYTGRRDVGPLCMTLLKPNRSLGRSAATSEERATRDMVAAAERCLLSGTKIIYWKR